MTLNIRTLSADSDDFAAELSRLTAWEGVSDDQVQAVVSEVLSEVKQHGDKALLQYTRQFDQLDCQQFAELEMSSERLESAWLSLPEQQQQALQQAADRIEAYHQHQKQESWSYTEANGTQLGQQVRALDRVGIYVPGGKATYPSSVLMNALPAKVAGVSEIIMTVPTPGGEYNPMVLAAAHLAGVSRVFTIGGAQAIAALAYGTQTVPKVDKIVGPGNIYVATAKRMVFGQVGLDMIAGPSEIMVVCDGQTDPDWIAMDLFSQAEHDELAQAILVSPDAGFLKRVEASMNKLLPELSRTEIIRQSIEARGAFIQVKNLQQAVDIINIVAPEHLELSLDQPENLLPEIRHAGAIFMGRYTPEALGDYCAGPNHVLPTSGTARFSSPLGVYDFQKRSSIIYCSAAGGAELGEVAQVLAESESLQAHARSARYRCNNT